MKGINWSIKGDEHVLETHYGKAVITAIKVPDELNIYRYAASFEPFEGDNILAPYEFIAFAEAESWVFYGAVLEADLPIGNDASNNLKLNTTLDYCEKLLPADIHPTHFQRLKIIKDILHGNHFYDDTIPESPRDKISLDWQEINSAHYAQTPFGTAHIIEKRKNRKWNFGGAISYQPRIIYNDEVILQGFSSSNFDAAEEWIFEKLNQLMNPTGGKTDLDNLAFTLQICGSMLPDNTDMLHPLRLQWIAGRIG